MNDNIAVDLGEMGCAVYCMENNRPTQIALNNDLFPCTAILENGEINVTQKYQKMRIEERRHVCRFRKLVGKSYNEYVAMGYKENEFGCPIVCGLNDTPLFVLDQSHQLSCEDILTEILKYIRHKAGVRMRLEISKCCITVPADWNNIQKDIIKKAIEKAGMQCFAIIANPFAAVISKALPQSILMDGVFLIHDLSASSCTTSLIRVINGEMQLRQRITNETIGGDSFETILFEYVVSNVYSSCNKHIFTKKRNYIHDYYSLKALCEEKIERLSERESLNLELVDYVEDNELGEDESVSFGIKSCDIASLFGSTISKMRDIIIEVIDKEKNSKDEPFSKNDITDVILVGGTTRIIPIGNMISSIFDRHQTIHNTDPELCVAIGALNYMQYIITTGNQIPLSLNLILPFDIGIGVDGMDVFRIFAKCTPVPCKTSLLCSISTGSSELITAAFKGTIVEKANTASCTFVKMIRVMTGKISEVVVEISVDVDFVMRIKVINNSDNSVITLENIQLMV